jgi:hypothetical protein
MSWREESRFEVMRKAPGKEERDSIKARDSPWLL